MSGKRGAPRRPRSLFVTCLGTGGQVQGRTVDLSRGGMLLEVKERGARPSGDQPAGIIPFAARIADLFPEGMDAVFGDGAVRIQAFVVRVATHPTDAGTMRLGCCFHAELTDAQCRLLGLDASTVTDPALEVAADDLTAPEAAAVAARVAAPAPAFLAASAPQAPADDVRNMEDAEPWGDELARIGRWNAAAVTRPQPMRVARGTVLVHLFSRNGPLIGPRFVGTLTEVRGKSLVVDLTLPAGESDPVAYGAMIGSGVRAVCLRDGRVLWDVPGRVHHIGAPDGGTDVARVTMAAARVPPATIRRIAAALSVSPAA